MKEKKKGLKEIRDLYLFGEAAIHTIDNGKYLSLSITSLLVISVSRRTHPLRLPAFFDHYPLGKSNALADKVLIL